MTNLRRAEVRAKSAWRRLRRLRAKRAGISRKFETLAALIPSIVVLLHLVMKASAGMPEGPTASPVEVPGRKNPPAALTPIVVPEPNVAVLSGLGLAALFYLRRRHGLGPIATAHPSKIAAAVA